MADETKQQEPDRSEPVPEGQAELERLYQEGLAKDKDAPYKGVEIRTRDELEWIMAQRHWSGKGILPEGMGRANLSGADISNANLNNAPLWGANLSGANLSHAYLRGMDLQGANLCDAILRNANLSGAILGGANLNGADLLRANLSGADLQGVNLSDAKLFQANLGGTDLEYANLSGADFSGVNLDNKTLVANVTLSNSNMRLADVTWGETNLTIVDWEPVQTLGDEAQAWKLKGGNSTTKSRYIRLGEWKAALRAYRLLTTALRDQGMNEEADRFTYRARVCQQQVQRYQGRRGQYVWSGLLDLLAGYGFRPRRSFIAYVLIILAFATFYFFVGQGGHALSPPESIVVSMTAFHGRGFFTGQFSPGDPQAYAAAIEAFLGLMIEVSFIATFTQRYFGR